MRQLALSIKNALLLPFRAWRNYRLERLALEVKAQSAPFEQMAAIVREAMDAQREQTKVLQTWMEMFRVADIPTSTTVRDEDEVRAEVDRSFNNMTPAQQLEWVHHEIDSDIFADLARD